MSTYMLVARKKDDNTFKIIGIKESWYKSGGDDQNVSYKNSLHICRIKIIHITGTDV